MKRTASARCWLGPAIALLATGCVTNPQPIPLPLTPPDPSSVYVSNPEESRSAVATGLPGAVGSTEEVEVFVEALPSGQQGRGPAYADGSFSLRLGIAAGDRLEIWIERDGERSSRVALPFTEVTPNDAALVIQSLSPVAQDGTTTMIGRAGAGDLIVLGNRRSGAATSTLADSTAGFSARIAAAAGDLLAVFSVDEKTRWPSAAVEMTVPGP